MRRCSCCRQFKPIEDFTIDRSKKSGLRYDCKDCANARQKRYRSTEAGKAIRRIHRNRFASTEAGKAVQKRCLQKYPEKKRARNIVTLAIKHGELTQQPCQKCGASPAEAHHEDYSKPLEVEWLCKKHHAEKDQIGL
jgi:hypothetical protein